MSFLRSRQRSANAAKDRLQLVLIHDRSGLSPGKLEALKDELIEVVSRHIDIDIDAVHVTLTNERDRQRLVAEVPLAPIRGRRQDRD